jgi:tRNA modification GTPase
MFHVKHSLDDTIAAIATPPGLGGVGVIRVSGGKALEILKSIFISSSENSDFESHRAYHGWIRGPGGEAIDEVMAVHMRGPNSYTGEEVVEVSCHGGLAVLHAVLGLAVGLGARLPERGEFSRRAFLNGKIDLLKAEAILDLVSARTGRGVSVAADQLAGSLSKLISRLRGELVGLLAEVEASIDFPDDVEVKDLRPRVDSVKDEVNKLIATAGSGKLIREGARMAIVGKPNVGKSSLLNALLGEERAIVTEIPGTTRDTIEEAIDIKGIPFVVIDTAGIRHPRDKAEEFGVEKTRAEIAGADIVLLVLDASKGLGDEDAALLEEVSGARVMLALNKVDLGVAISLNGYRNSCPQFKVSALLGTGMGELRAGIFDFVVEEQGMEGVGGVLINLRHQGCLLKARDALDKALDACDGKCYSDLVAVDLKGAIVALGEVSGEDVSEEVINAIFDQFCVGK